jgi:hypothetical protein
MFLQKLRERFKSEYSPETHHRLNGFDLEFTAIFIQTTRELLCIVTRRFSKPFVDPS